MAFLTAISGTAFAGQAVVPSRSVCAAHPARGSRRAVHRRACPTPGGGTPGGGSSGVRVSRARASIEKEVSAELTAAMRRKDAAALKTLRSIRAAFLTALKAEGAGEALSDDEAVGVLRKLAKMRAESIAMFRDGGRDDLADAEAAELDMIERWLPKLAGEDDVRQWVADAVQATGASGPGDMGKVMGVIMKQHKGEADGNMVRAIVSEALKS